jgi:hypothetical protein
MTTTSPQDPHRPPNEPDSTRSNESANQLNGLLDDSETGPDLMVPEETPPTPSDVTLTDPGMKPEETQSNEPPD